MTYTKALGVLDHLTDEELLTRVYMNTDSTSMEVELARRLEHALDEMASRPVSLEQILRERGV